MAKKEWVSLLAGLVLATVGVTAFALSDGRPAESALQAPTAPVVAPALGPSESEAVDFAGEVSAAAPIPVAAGTLAEVGSLREIDPAAFGIPPEVARVLASRGVVLTVRQPGGGAVLGGGEAR